MLTFSENPVTVTAITPISGIARFAEVSPPGHEPESRDYLPKTIDAGARIAFSTNYEYDEARWLRGFVYEVAWYEIRGDSRRGFQARARLSGAEPPLT